MEKYLEIILKLTISSICGFLIGWERSNKHKEAGIRTHAIVSLTATLMMIVSKYGFADVNNFDASRVAAQIVSGIGFLGAGIIFVKDESKISGLTTAAGIWGTTGVGMAIGAGMYFLGLVSSVYLVLIHVISKTK